MEIAESSPKSFRDNFDAQSLNLSKKAHDLKELLLESNEEFMCFQLYQVPGSRFEEIAMFCKRNAFIRPIKSSSIETSLFLVEGICDILFLSNDGNITELIRLDSQSKQQCYFLRIPPNTMYALLVHSADALILVASASDRGSVPNENTKWIQMETDIKKVMNLIQEFEESFAKIVEKKRGLIPNRSLIRESEKVLRLNGSNALDIAITEELIQTLNREGLDRIRICIHERDDSVLQEMFIALANNTFIVPSLHTDKNESILLLDGLATVVFFDNWGHVTSRIPLAPYGNSLGRATYCQIIAGQVHSVIVESEYVLIKETTSGPFVPRNTFFPEWAPRFSTNEEAERYNLACLRVRTS